MSVEDEALRGKVMVAIHAARANALHEEHLQSKVARNRLVSSTASLFQASSSIIVFDGDPVVVVVHDHYFALPPPTLHAGHVPLHVGAVRARLVFPSQELPVLRVVLRVFSHCQLTMIQLKDVRFLTYLSAFTSNLFSHIILQERSCY